MHKFGVTIFFFSVPAASVGPLTLQYRSHVHTTGLLSTALPLQLSMIDLLTGVAHTPVGAAAVDVTVPQPKPSCSCPRSIQHTPTTVSETSIATLTLSALHAPRSGRTHTAVQASLARMIRDFSSRLSPLCHILEFSGR